MLGNLISGFIVILIGVTLAPTVANEVYASQYQNSTHVGNMTGASGTIMGLVTLFYTLGVASAAIAIAVFGLRKAGLM